MNNPLRADFRKIGPHVFGILVLAGLVYAPGLIARVVLGSVMLAGYAFMILQLRKLPNIKQYVTRMKELEFILQSAKEGIYGLDLEGKTTFANPASLQITGHTESEMIGALQHALIHHTKSDGSSYPKEQCHIYAAFKRGAAQTVDNEVFWHKDGYSIPVEYTSTPMLDEHGKVCGAVVVFRDITERKKAKENQRALILSLAEHFERDVKKIVDTVWASAQALKVTEEHLTIASEEMRQQVKAIVIASEQASAGARAANAEMEQLKGVFAEIEKQAQFASQAADGIGMQVGQNKEAPALVLGVINKQSVADMDMAASVQKAVVCAEQVSAIAGNVMKTAEKTQQASRNVSGAVEELFEQTETLQTQVDAFLAQVRVRA